MREEAKEDVYRARRGEADCSTSGPGVESKAGQVESCAASHVHRCDEAPLACFKLTCNEQAKE